MVWVLIDCAGTERTNRRREGGVSWYASLAGGVRLRRLYCRVSDWEGGYSVSRVPTTLIVRYTNGTHTAVVSVFVRGFDSLGGVRRRGGEGGVFRSQVFVAGVDLSVSGAIFVLCAI